MSEDCLKDNIVLREPTKQDGAAIWELVKACAPLDENSMYCNLIQADHFNQTCVVAEYGGDIVGWISAYLKPGSDDTLFVWQVAVASQARGCGLALSMLEFILGKEVCQNVEMVETTITSGNIASWALFEKLAASVDGELSRRAYYEEDEHFDGRHETEHLVSIAFSRDSELAA